MISADEIILALVTVSLVYLMLKKSGHNDPLNSLKELIDALFYYSLLVTCWLIWAFLKFGGIL